MRSKLLTQEAEKTFLLVFDPGEEVAGGLEEFARENQLTAARFTGIGAFCDVKLGWFDVEQKDYQEIPINEQVEVLSLVGNIAVDEDHPKIHAHLVVGKRDGTAHGGHLLEAHVRPTLEIVLIESPAHIARSTDPQTGLALLDPEAATLPPRGGRKIHQEVR